MGLPVPNSKEKIINAAIDLFAENGYTETTLKKIAEAAGIKAPSIYNYFESKIQILEYALNIYSSFHRDRLPVITDAYLQEHEPRAVLKELFFSFPPTSATMYLKIVKIFLQEQYRNSEVRDYMKNHYLGDMQLKIQRILDKMVQFGRISPVNTELFAEVLHSLNVKSAIEACHYIDNPEDRPHDRWLEATDFVIDMIVSA